MIKRLTVLLLTLFALASGALACGLGPTPTLAPMPTPTLTPTPIPTLIPTPTLSSVEAVQILCLEVEQSYPEIEEEFSQPIAEVARRILVRLGLQVVAEGAPCDATLAIALTGRALGLAYAPGYCYSGAEVSGEVTLTVPGCEPLTTPVEGRVPTPLYISSCPVEPGGAPFDRAWPEALLDGLGHLWGPRVLVQALGDEDVFVRSPAARVLGEMGLEAVPPLIQALEDENVQVRGGAVWALRLMGPEAKEAVPALIQALGDEDVFVCRDAALALGEIGPEEGVILALSQALEDEEWLVRRAAARVLGNIGPEEGVVVALIEALEDENVQVRGGAAIALREIGPEAVEAVPALVQALGDEESFVRARVAGALEAITGQDFGEDAARWQQWWEEQQ